jgi:hypothetical protein
VRQYERDPRVPVPDTEWELARAEVKDGEVRLTPSNIDLYIKGGFKPGWIYEFIYDTEGSRVMNLGFLGIRDLLSLLRYETHDAAGNSNPLAGHVEKIYGTGASLSGRVIREYVYEGWNVDATGRRVFDAVHTHTGSFVPFARTRAERQVSGDPRPSIEERYPSHAAYVAAVTQVCEARVREGLMLQEDADRFIAAAQQKNPLDASVRLGPLIQAGAYTGR